MGLGKTSKLSKIIRVILIFGLLCCFFEEMLRNATKFIDGKTSFSVSNFFKEKPEPLPTFSICAEPAWNENYLE